MTAFFFTHKVQSHIVKSSRVPVTSNCTLPQ